MYTYKLHLRQVFYEMFSPPIQSQTTSENTYCFYFAAAYLLVPVIIVSRQVCAQGGSYIIHLKGLSIN